MNFVSAMGSIKHGSDFDVRGVCVCVWFSSIRGAYAHNISTNTNVRYLRRMIMKFFDDFAGLVNGMVETVRKKNADYTADRDPLYNFKKCEQLDIPAWKGILVRIQDKMSRLESFAVKGSYEVKDESFEDTALDMANYLLLMILARREGITNVMEKEPKQDEDEQNIAYRMRRKLDIQQLKTEPEYELNVKFPDLTIGDNPITGIWPPNKITCSNVSMLAREEEYQMDLPLVDKGVIK